MITTRSTKPELLAHIATLDAQLLAQGQAVRTLRDALSMAQSAPVLPAGRVSHAAYYDYVAAQRMAARTCGLRVSTYMTYAQWSAT